MKMHENELTIDSALVKALIDEQAPEYSHYSIKPVCSSGTDNALFKLGNDYVARLPRVEWTAGSATNGINKEYRFVPQIEKLLSTPVSTPVFKGRSSHDYPYEWLIIKWNEGIVPAFESDNEYNQLAKELATFLNQFHCISLKEGPASRRGVPLISLYEQTKACIYQLKNELNIHLAIMLWEKLCHIDDWDTPPVWVHGDFLPGNILIKNNRLSAVIDFSDVGIGDPACDLVIAWSLFNPKSREIFKTTLCEIDEKTWERGKGWALSIATIMLPYYKDTNPILAKLARRMLSLILAP